MYLIFSHCFCLFVSLLVWLLLPCFRGFIPYELTSLEIPSIVINTCRVTVQHTLLIKNFTMCCESMSDDNNNDSNTDNEAFNDNNNNSV
jgi:hypothetical protein